MNLKYQLLVAAAALSLGACSTDDTTTDPVPEKGGYKISFAVAEDSETRTTLSETDVMRWVPTDKVGIYTVGTKNTNSNTLTIADVNQSPVEFIGVLENLVSKGDKFYAYYPYNAEQSTKPKAVTLTIPAEQTQTKAGQYGGQSHPLVAVPMTIEWEKESYAGRINSARFRLLGAIVELQIYSSNEKLRGENIQSVTFTSESELAGDFTFDLTSVTVKGELPITGYELTEVTTTLAEPAAIPATKEAAALVYLTIAPGEYSGDFVVTTNEAQYTFSLAEPMTFDRAVIKGLSTDLATAEVRTPLFAETDPIPFKDEVVKQICVAPEVDGVKNWDTNNDGELSYKEAAAVTDLEARFQTTSINSFNELQYFTGLESIGGYTFSDCSSLTSITIPNGVTAIEGWAFTGCSGLTSITIPGTVNSIGDFAFQVCHSLTSIQLQDGLREIGDYAFTGCSSLESINIPQTVRTIGGGVFNECTSLAAFEGEYTSEDRRCLILNGTLKAFAQAGLTETKYTIPAGVTAIGDYAFSQCSSLTSINIPDGVTAIGDGAFAGCSGLTSVYCERTDPPTLGIEAFFNTLESLKIYVPAASVETYKAAEGWTDYKSKIVAVGSQPEPGENDPIIFADTNVKAICIAKENGWNTDGDGELSYKEAAAVTEIGKQFSGNESILSFNELQYFTGLTSIGESAFYDCSNLTSITIPDGVTEIGDFAFAFCSSLTSINIPQKVSSIGSGAFVGCTSLSAFEGNYMSDDHRCLIVDSKLLAFAQAGLTESEYTIPNGVTAIGEGAFAFCSSLTSITIPAGVEAIGVGAFQECSNLTSITIPDKVTKIEDNTFSSCKNLTSITIPAGVTEIGNYAFYYCSSLQSITPDGVTSIGNNAFQGCTSLTSITLPDVVTSIGEYAFQNCGLTSITIPKGVTGIGEKTFEQCLNLTSVTISDGVEAIGNYAFRDCTSLRSVYCKPTTPPTLGNDVFSYAPVTIYVPKNSVDTYKTTAGWSGYTIKDNSSAGE